MVFHGDRETYSIYFDMHCYGLNPFLSVRVVAYLVEMFCMGTAVDEAYMIKELTEGYDIDNECFLVENAITQLEVHGYLITDRSNLLRLGKKGRKEVVKYLKTVGLVANN